MISFTAHGGLAVSKVASHLQGCGFDSCFHPVCAWSLQVLLTLPGFPPGTPVSSPKDMRYRPIGLQQVVT